jgi:hypothetical protein
LLPGGRVAYRIKKVAHRTRDKVRVMTPLEFLARLSALIPPPRYPLVRYHGVLAPASNWRRDVVPKPRESNHTCMRTAPKPVKRMPPQSKPSDQPEPKSRNPERSVVAPDAVAREQVHALPKFAPGVTLLAPNVLSVRHWDRLLGGRLLAPAARVDWATLLQRTFQVDVLACPTCSGRLRVLGQITEPALIRLVLENVGLPTDTPPPARARDPTALLAEFDAN